MSLPSDLRIVIKSTDGTVDRQVPQSKLLTPSWELDRFGGYGRCTLPTTVDYRSMTRVQQGDQVLIYYLGVLKYQGYIVDRGKSMGEPRKLTFLCYGASFWLRRQPVNRQYAWPAGSQDVANAFATFCQDWLLGSIGPGGTRMAFNAEAQAIGTTILALDARNKISADVLDNLVSEAGNLAIWGTDIDGNGKNRIYMRPFSPASPPTYVIRTPGTATASGESPETIGDLVNSLTVEGAAPKHPQLLHNGNWQLPVFSQDGVGNVIPNGDMEIVGSNWTLSANAAYGGEQTSGPARQVPFVNRRYVAFDGAGANISQTVTPAGSQDLTTAANAGKTFTFSLQACKSISTQTATGSAVLVFKDAGGTTVDTFQINPGLINPIGQDYEKFSLVFTMPAGATHFDITIRCDSYTQYSPAFHGGLVIDDVQLYNSSVVYQDGWQVSEAGDASLSTIDWTNAESYTGSGCSVLIDGTTTADSDGHDIELTSASAPLTYHSSANQYAKFRVLPGQQLRFGAVCKSPKQPAVNTAFPALELVLDWYDGSGNFVGAGSVQHFAAPGGQVSDWKYYECLGTVPAGATQALARFLVRTTGSVLVGALSVRDVGAPSIAPDANGVPGFYQAEGNLVYLINANDGYLAQTYLPSTGATSPAPPATSSVAAPTTVCVPTAASVAAGSQQTGFLAGVYTVGYTVVIGGIESTVGGKATVTLAAGQQINVAMIGSLPGGTTAVKYYVNPPAPLGGSPLASPYYIAGSNSAGQAISLTTFQHVPAYYFSQGLYGVQADKVQSDNVVDLAGAMSVADAIFRAKGLPIYRPVVSILGDNRPFWPGQTVLLTGGDGVSLTPTALPIVRVRQTHDGILKTTLELQREAPDVSITMKRLFLGLLRSQGAGSNSFGSAGGPGNPSNGGGGSSGGGIVTTDGTNTVAVTTKLSFTRGAISNPATGEAAYTPASATTGALGEIKLAGALGGPSSTALVPVLNSTGVTGAAYGDASHVSTFTVANDGRLTAANSVVIVITESQVTGLVSDLAARPTGSGTTGNYAIWTGSTVVGNGHLSQGSAANTGDTALYGGVAGPGALYLDPAAGAPYGGVRSDFSGETLAVGVGATKVVGANYYDNTHSGAYFRVDTRGANTDQVFGFWVQATTDSTNGVLIAKVSTLGNIVSLPKTGGCGFVLAGVTSASVTSPPSGAIIWDTGATAVKYYDGSSWQTVGTGTVTSVGLTVPSWLAVTGSPVTGAGTLAVTATSGQTANQVLATPNGSTGAVGLRSIAGADLPTTGIKINVSSGDTTADYLFTKLVAGTNITITKNNAGGNETITIAATGGGSGTVTTFSVTSVPSWLSASVANASTTPALTLAAATGQASDKVLCTGSGTSVALQDLPATSIPSLAASKITSGQLAVARGGTGLDGSATGGSKQYVKQASAAGAFTVGTIPMSDLGTGTTDATTVLRGDGTWVVPSSLALPTDFLTGCVPAWSSTTALVIGTGSYYHPGTNTLVTVSSPITYSPTLAATAWRYIYGKSDGTLTDSATAPTIYQGTAGKTGVNGDRYLGEVLTDGSSHIRNFMCVGDRVFWRLDIGSAPMKILNLSSSLTTTALTTISCSTVVPATATAIGVRIQLGTQASIGLGTSDGFTVTAATNGSYIAAGPTDLQAEIILNTSQAIQYIDQTGATTSITVMEVERYIRGR